MTQLTTSDGNTLEAMWTQADDPRATVVLCHPHPQHGGTMTAPLMNHVTDGLAARGFSVLRFNFRGVGDSTGEHDFGDGELLDIDAAMAEAKAGGLPLFLAGWSFGAATSLVWMATRDVAIGWAGIAPPVRSERTPQLPISLPEAERTFILGDRDQFATVEDVQDYVNNVGGTLHVLTGSDHFFYFREENVAEMIATAFGFTDQLAD